MSWTFVTDVVSLSDPSKVYTIKRSDRGLYGCDCPAWRFSKRYGANGLQRLCKHIEHALPQIIAQRIEPDARVPIPRPGVPGGLAAAAAAFADKMKVKMEPRSGVASFAARRSSVVANGLAPGRRMIALED